MPFVSSPYLIVVCTSVMILNKSAESWRLWHVPYVTEIKSFVVWYGDSCRCLLMSFVILKKFLLFLGESFFRMSRCWVLS